MPNYTLFIPAGFNPRKVIIKTNIRCSSQIHRRYIKLFIFMFTMDAVKAFLLVCFNFSFSDGRIFKSSKITPSGNIEKSKVGYSVSVDNNFVAIGNPYDRSRGLENAGSFSVFHYKNKEWRYSVIQKTPRDLLESSNFGYSIDILGERLIVGCPYDVDNEDRYSPGAAYVYMYVMNHWLQMAKLTANGGARAQRFGYAVAINDDFAVIGNPTSLNNKGEVYVYKYADYTWSLNTKLKPRDVRWGDWFGAALAIDRSRVVIGAPCYDLNFGTGSVYLYKHNGSSWQLESKLDPSNPVRFFGFSIDIDQNRIVVGSKTEDGGSAYIFKQLQKDFWGLENILRMFDDGKSKFGSSVSVSGNKVVISRSKSKDRHGCIFIYQVTRGIWHKKELLIPWDVTDRQNDFGQSIAISGNNVIVSNEEEGLENQELLRGSVYVYQIYSPYIFDNFIR